MMPDKIYIFKDGDELWYKPEEWETPPPGRVEYIRKDALLEWVKACYKATENDNLLSDIFKQGALYELHRVILKIESL